MRFLGGALLALAIAAPSFAQGLFDDNEARRRIEVLRQQVTENQRLVDERLARIETSVSDVSDRRAVLELATQIEALRGEMARMRGQIEVVGHQVETWDKRQRDLYLDIDTRLRRLEQAREEQAAAAEAAAVAAAAAAAAAPDKPPAPPTAAADPAVAAAETRAYQAALDQFKLGNYALAVSAMQGFLVTYPNSALAPNAQYWIGMSYSGQRDYKSAIAAQRQVLTTWPDSDKAPDALLSIASSQETMGDRKSALQTLQDLIARYPTSSAAASAKQRLAAFVKR
jgi:tol-pal system protein YbgF